MVSVAWDFNLMEWYSSRLKPQQKRNVVIVPYSRITMQTLTAFGLSMLAVPPCCCWVSPGSGEEYVGSHQMKPVAFFKVHFGGSVLRSGLSRIHTCPRWSGWFRKVRHAADNLKEVHLPVDLLDWYSLCLEQRPPSSPLCVEISSAGFKIAVLTSYLLFWASWAHHPCLSSLSLLKSCKC